jgi:molecular chaperone GrpE
MTKDSDMNKKDDNKNDDNLDKNEPDLAEEQIAQKSQQPAAGQAESAEIEPEMISSQPTVSQEEFEKLKAEMDEVKDLAAQMEVQLKRAVADYQNLEKRVAEGRSEFADWATAEFIKRILPVMHNFDQVVKGAGEEERKSGWFKGVEMSVKQLQDALRSEGLDEIEADGQFEPSLHEAVDTGKGDHDKILNVVEKGYRLNGKVLKPAKVVVGRK